MASLRKQLLEASKDVRKKLKVPFQVRKDKKALESWLIDVESNVEDLKFKIQEAKGAEDFDPDKILEHIDNLELEERRLKQGQSLLDELFGDDAPDISEGE